MRIKLTLKSDFKTIPINSNHFISSLIYGYLADSDTNFSTKLHNGFFKNGPKNFKYFTFSRFQIPEKKIEGSNIRILSPEFYLYISSPWYEFMQNLINGLLRIAILRLGKEEFKILKVETLKNDLEEFKGNNDLIINFSFLSPFVLTTKKMFKGELNKYYYKPEDDIDEISEKLKQNLINKYKFFYNKTDINEDIKIKLDEKYLALKKAKVLVHYIKESQDIKIPAIMCPFKIRGNYDIINFGYECGFGELNSAGFGMVKLVLK